MAGGLARGEVRLYQFAAPDKRRPVVVLTRPSSLPQLVDATVAHITSSIRGVDSEVYLDESDGMKGPCVVNLHKLTTVKQHRLGRRIAQLSPEKMKMICQALRFSLGCD
jgi:mRNA interferase MazF